MRIGIPRALYYYRYYPLWQTFFQSLGCEVVFSDPTTKETLDNGVAAVVDGICLPVKIYLGHVCNLLTKDVDYLFVPRIISVAKREYICPKFMGLPALVRNCISDVPQLLSPEIDGRKSNLQIMQAYLHLGRRFAPLPTVIRAYRHAVQQQQLYENQRLIDNIDVKSSTLRIGLLGHEYLLYDDFASVGISKLLKQAGCQIISMDQISSKVVDDYNRNIKKRMFWTSGKRIIGAVNYYTANVDGIISLMAFACGTDSLTMDLVERHCRRHHIPHLLLSLDEHTGKAGIVTRVEAFLELLKRRKQRENNLSTYGPLLSRG